MTSLDEVCDVIRNCDKDVFNSIFDVKSSRVITALTGIADSGFDAISTYVNFIMAAVSADGKLTKPEYELIKPIFDMLNGSDSTYEDALGIFRQLNLGDSENLRDTVDRMVTMVGMISPDMKNDMILLTLMVCAVDGEITPEEKSWISQLIAPLRFELGPMEVIDLFLTRAGVFTLGTVLDGKPRMRALGFKAVLDGRIYFGVGTFKDVYAQLRANPYCEIYACVEDEFLRWDGKAVFSDDERLVAIAAKAMPQVMDMYRENGWDMAFFTLDCGHAEVVNANNTKVALM